MNSALLTLYRSLTRHRLYAILNVGGLALGLAVFIVLMLFVRFETSFDKVLPGWDKLWVLQERYALPGAPTEPDQYSMGNELIQLKGDFPQLVGTRYYPVGATVRQGPESTAETLAAVDASYFTLFPYKGVA
ncbi:MAG TPA: ABC transporter permease, partial [Sphingomonas sp.]